MTDGGYKELKIWSAGKELVKAVYAKLRTFPVEERYALCDQLRRAVVSIPSNIAEGYGRDTHKDFAHYLSLARGSLFEVATQIEIAIDLRYMERDEKLDEQINELSRMIAAFRTRLLTTDTPSPRSTLRTPHSALCTKSPHSALRTPHS